MECSIRSSSLVPPSPLSGRGVTSIPAKFRLPRLKVSIKRSGVVFCQATGSGDKGFGNGIPRVPGQVFVEEAIGAEYGEGFETFRMDGPLKVDVDYLNDRLQECFLQRVRHSMKPDEAFGLIFSWDNVMVDTRSLKLNVWKQLASEEGKEFPEDMHTRKLILHAAADHVLRKVLCWAEEESELERLKSRLLKLYYDNLLKLDKPIEGLKVWLDAIYTAGIPCAIVSSLDRMHMHECLQKMGLKKYFQAFVTLEDGMESIAHRFLSAALKMDRKPSKCVVFEDDPRGITAAHNCTMMVVGLIGAHPAYELDQADLAVASYSELSVINLRRLFAHKGSNFMDLQKQIIDKSPPKRKLMTDTIY
ncbi:5-amino-6-(5-phospho-D-ribitylamino)uracil phosphatase, chloroplastic [Curcuma longa]|uniref:5-amino-6-(5-phospho-D-ribitylamino)uracil phosphatase, chloroplastic n=1 Tax=Curcuma longa TaxID=136217 RepID=UPI003D9F9A88